MIEGGREGERERAVGEDRERVRGLDTMLWH